MANYLQGRDHLEDRFTAGDLPMTTVLRILRILRTTDLLAATPNLQSYQARCEARPAFQRALASQMSVFRNGEQSPRAQA